MILSLCLGSLSVGAQVKEFVVEGHVNLPDGYSVSICCHTDTADIVSVAEGKIIDGKFLLKGEMEQAQPGTLMTNNLELVEKYHWPTDSIHWTYTDIFLSPGKIKVDEKLHVTGGIIQQEWNDYQAMQKCGDREWKFIDSHPQSVISVYLANNLLKRGYQLSPEQVAHLEHTIISVPEDPKRMEEFKQRIAYAKKTTRGGDLVDLELKDVNGKLCHLLDVVPKNNKYVLVDFWASWCPDCRKENPNIVAAWNKYKDKNFTILGVSLDRKKEPWLAAIEKDQLAWTHVSDLKDWKSDAAVQYAIRWIPMNFLLDPNGVILAVGLEGEALQQKLDEVLK